MIGETGVAGLGIRGVGRALFGASAWLDQAGCALLAAVPPALLTPSRDRERLRRNERLAGSHAGRRCFILGNGPSLRQEDLAPLAGEILLTVNQGHLFARDRGLTPAFHACVDRLYLEPAFRDHFHDWAAFQRETGAVLLLSTELADRFSELGLAPEHFAVKQFLKSTYFDRAGRPAPLDLSDVQPGYLSVIHFAIVAALHMGFAEICLLGCDMDFFVRPDDAFTHSYEDEQAAAQAPTAADLFGWDQVELMAWCLDEFRAFRQLRLLAESRGARIVNAGTGGALNVFPREPLRALAKRIKEAA